MSTAITNKLHPTTTTIITPNDVGDESLVCSQAKSLEATQPTHHEHTEAAHRIQY